MPDSDSLDIYDARVQKGMWYALYFGNSEGEDGEE